MTILATGAPIGAGPAEPAAGRRARPRNLIQWIDRADPFMMCAWVLSTLMNYGWAAPLRYLAAGYFFACTIIFARQTLPILTRAWPTFIIAAFCVVSALWAPSADEAIRKGISFAMTSVVAIYAASRIQGRYILMAYVAGEAVAAILSIKEPSLQGGAWTGIFGQKNFLAVNMFILYVCSLSLALDRDNNRWIRLGALACVPMAFMLILLAKSGTTTILLIGASAFLVFQAFIWQPASRVPHMRAVMVAAAVVLACLGCLIVFGLMQVDIKTAVFDALGKDSTLTGRTYLWEIAAREMHEHPLTGLGANGFWRENLGLANSITQYFFYESYVHFSFHNSYYENGVSFGYPGYYGTIFVAAWALGSAGLNWLRNQTLMNAAFFIIAAMIIIRSNTEIDLAQEFFSTPVLLFIAASRKEKLFDRWRKQPAVAPEPEPPHPSLMQRVR